MCAYIWWQNTQKPYKVTYKIKLMGHLGPNEKVYVKDSIGFFGAFETHTMTKQIKKTGKINWSFGTF